MINLIKRKSLTKKKTNKVTIEGVFFKKVISHRDKRGFFRELFRSDDKYNNKNFKQISHSFIKKNVIKAWHLHKKQYQWNYLLKGKINVILYDNRKKSKTYKNKLSFEINTGKKSLIYYFPPGIAHGYKTLAKNNHMIYATSNTYNQKEEYKIPLKNKFIPDYFSEK